jgi:oligopeptide/dipeptide ABC transporter ATP-binding protein
MSHAATALLTARGLNKRFVRSRSVVDRLFGRRHPQVTALSDVNLWLARAEVLGLVGESGCGKSTLGRCLVGIQTPDSGMVVLEEGAPGTGGSLRMQMIFQDPYTSLNPRMTVGAALGEVLVVHRPDLRPAQRLRTVHQLLEQVGLDTTFALRFPHELSGGQRQRISIARALAVEPEVIVADEPVSALDVSVQAQIINLLQDLQRARGLAMIFISHDLGVVRHICSRVMVMYRGEIVEEQSAEALFARPFHPYTSALLAAIPDPDPTRRSHAPAIEGEVAAVNDAETGCRFSDRCAFAQLVCRSEHPSLRTPAGSDDAAVRCHFAEDIRSGRAIPAREKQK